MVNSINDTFPLALQVVDPAQIVEADVREDLLDGREPFSRIMTAREQVPPGGALVVRAIFEPVPLYRVMSREGFAHHTEELAPDDWRVWFYPEVTVLDVRDMDPPEPLAHTLAALEQLPDDGTLVQVNVRVPRFLLPKSFIDHGEGLSSLLFRSGLRTLWSCFSCALARPAMSSSHFTCAQTRDSTSSMVLHMYLVSCF